MLRLARDSKSSSVRKHTVPLLTILALLLLAGLGHMQAQTTVATYSFEDNAADGWTSFNGASTPASTTLAAYDGSHSLVTTTSVTGSGGPALNAGTLLLAGAKYTITGWVRLANGAPASNANFTIQRSDPSCSGGTCYDTIGAYQVAVNNSGWTQIGGSYTASTTETALNLYAQLVGATSAQTFYLDDVVITETAPPPGGTPVASYPFTDGGLDGWTPMGSATLTNAAAPLADPKGNEHSLLISNRTATYMGPSLNLLGVNNIVAGATYQVTAYVLLAAPDGSNPTATLSTDTADCATTGAYGNLATSGPLSATTWTKVQGTFSFSDQPGPPTSLLLYLQSTSATDSFYMTDVSISELAPTPPNASQQDNTGISSTFEDGGLDGWNSRTGTSTVVNTTANAHTGTHSLLTTGRIANYDGPSISVSNKLYVGSRYNISGWVKLLPMDGSSHIINISLQTTVNGNTSYPSVTSYPGVTILADGQWHQINVMGYNMGSAYDPGAATLYFQTAPASGNDLVSFYLDDFQLTYVAPPSIQTSIPSIYQTLSPYFPVGAEIDQTDLTGPHNQLLTKHFDSIVSGNDMKWSSVEATKGTFNYGPADQEVGMAVCNKMRVRGHNLVWATGAQTPAYATGDGTNSPANQAVVAANIQEHIQNEVQHFGSKVYVWDVVNEPLDPSQPDCLAHGPFYKVLGKSYIDIALTAARQYAPAGTKLFINDYSTTDSSRLACLVQVVHDLRSRGIPIDGVGHEMHNSINYPSPQAIANAVDTLHEHFRDLEQQITEFDLSVYNAGDIKSDYGSAIPPAVLAEQGWLYERTFSLFRHLAGKISAVTIWGMADDDTWLDGFPVTRTDYPLPFDMGLQAKPAYWGIVDPKMLPGYGLKLSSSVTGTGKTYTITLTATNGDVGPAYTTLINSITLQHVEFRRSACTATVVPPSTFPVSLGDIPVSGTASASFNVTLSGCDGEGIWVVEVPWSSATYHTGTYIFMIELGHDRDHNSDGDRH